MTQASRHIGTRTGPLGATTLRGLRSKSWIYPLVGAVLVAGVGVWSRAALERTTRAELRADLETLLYAEVNALRIWLEAHRNNAEFVARAPYFNSLAKQVFDLTKKGESTPSSIVGSEVLTKLREYLAPILEANRYAGFAVVDTTGRILASQNDAFIGHVFQGAQFALFRRVLDSGQTAVTQPFRFEGKLPGNVAPLREGDPTMAVAAPVKDAGGQIQAVFVFRIRPEEFTRILTVGRSRGSGETYAFTRSGWMISASRFEDQLRKVGLLPDDPAASSVLAVQVRDPGGDLTAGYSTNVAREAQPLTRMAAEAISGRPGVDVEGYRDYRGVTVVGAWTWLEDYDFGVACEIDLKEAYRPVNLMRRAYWALLGVLGLSALAILAYSQYSYRLRVKVSEAQKLGQYTLIEKVGEGGMGEVYRASHVLLRRPTAVKVLRPEAASTERIQRFEREVQLTSQLAHPNTIAIYDYGRTPDGVFFYAMEFLSGLTLLDLVKKVGPLPEARIAYLLGQVCGSLAEAHEAGLIHRDIKPTNVMVCHRGGIPDMVKVLDFGLVKEVGGAAEQGLTQEGILTGTPLYMSPEAIRKPDLADARSDLYSLGAVAYYLVTGKQVFEGASVVEVCAKHIGEAPVPPSERVGRRVSPPLEALILRCLEKAPERRPQSAKELGELLGGIQDAGAWGPAEAESWWKEHGGAEGATAGAEPSPASKAPAVATPPTQKRPAD